MRHRSLLRNSMLAAAVAVVFAAGSGASVMAQDTTGSSMQSAPTTSSTSQTVPGKVDDAWITTKVKSELATAKNVKSTDISVTTVDGVVTLSGTVASAKQIKHVEHVAHQVKGVKSVDGSGLTIAATGSTSSDSMPASSSSTSH